MATYSSTKISDSHPAHSGAPSGECILYGTVTISGAAATGDLLRFFTVPMNFTVVEAVVHITDVDTHATPTATLIVGDADDTDRIIASSTAPRAGGFDRLSNTAGFLYQYTADTVVYGTIGTVATGATGTAKLALIGTLSQ